MKGLPDWWGRRFLLAELLLAFVATVVIAIFSELTGGRVLGEALIERREGLYTAVTGLYGSLLGFSLATAAIVLGHTESDRLRIVRESEHYETLWKVFFSTIRILAMATAFSLTSLLVDRETFQVGAMFYASLFLALLVVLRVGRTIWILQRVVGLVTAPSKARQEGEA